MFQEQTLISSDIEEYLRQHEYKQLVRFITCGNVDDGKSTLIGKLLYDSKMIFEDQLHAITRDSNRLGKSEQALDLSLLLDGLQSEREQGITIDVAYRYFYTNKRKFIIADTPGHEQYTRNMATGASTADLAIILIDARYGVQIQTKRHSFISHLLGIKHFIVAINKMDLVNYQEVRYQEIKHDYLTFSKEIGIKDVRFVPISALIGDNIISNSQNMPWYVSSPLIKCLEDIDISHDLNLIDFRFPVQYVNRPHLDFRGFSGTISSGEIAVGDEIVILPSYMTSKIKEIVTYDGRLETAKAGTAVTLVLTDEIDVSRGDVIVKQDNKPQISNTIDVNIVWMNDEVLTLNHTYYIKQGTKLTQGYFETIYYKKDVNTLEEYPAHLFHINEIGKARLHTFQKLVFDAYKENRQTGRFIIIDKITDNTVGVGMITKQISNQGENDVDYQSQTRHRRPAFFERILHRFIKKHYPHWKLKDLE